MQQNNSSYRTLFKPQYKCSKNKMIYSSCTNLSKFMITATSMFHCVDLLSKLVQYISNIVHTRQLGR